MVGKKTYVKKPKKLISYKRKNKRLPPYKKLGSNTLTLKTFKSNDPFPPRCFKTMTYSASSLLSLATAGSPLFGGDEHTFRLNSIFDPFIGTTPAPLNTKTYGYTEMATLYHRYKVNACLVEVSFFDPNLDGIVVGCLFNNPSSSVAMAGLSIGDIEKRPQGWTTSIANTGAQKYTFRQYYPMNVLFNLSKLQFKTDIDNSTSPVTGDPGSQPLLRVGIADANARSAGTTLFIQYTIRLTMFTEFYQRKQYT